MKKQKLTKSTIDRLPLADKGKQTDHWDSELQGFGVRTSATAKTFFVMKRVRGKLSRVTLGKYGVLTADEARKRAIKVLSELCDGVDVNQDKAKERLRGITLDKATDLYLEERDLKEGTKTFYQTMIDVHLKSWKSKPLKTITDDMVKAMHKKLSKDVGKVTANNAMKTLRAIYSYVLTETKGDLPDNPTKILSSQKVWNKVEPRKTRIQDYELPAWYQGVVEAKNPIIRDFLLFTMYNGLRKNEALELQWSDVDFRGRTFTVIDPKNGKDHTLPFTTFTESLLAERLTLRENDFVFPGTGKSGHLAEPRKQIEKIEHESGIHFMPHDLRRTFANVAQKIVTYSELKRLLNHTPEKSDVTQDYLEITVDDLREPMQKVADTLMVATHAWCPYTPAETQPEAEPEKVINLEERRRRKAA